MSSRVQSGLAVSPSLTLAFLQSTVQTESGSVSLNWKILSTRFVSSAFSAIQWPMPPKMSALIGPLGAAASALVAFLAFGFFTGMVS